MEKHTCGLCGRRFASGRALGGHMRSHVISAKAQALQRASPSPSPSPSPSAYSAASAAEARGKGRSHGLREKPKRSLWVADKEFSPAAAAAVVDGFSSVVQDGESETESSMAPILPTRRRPTPEAPEHVSSSVSDAATEEDVARCLMMLSRDIWTQSAAAEDEDEEEAGDRGSDDEDRIDGRSRRQRRRPHPAGRSRYQCGTCKKVFRSYQALGGHRAGHKKLRGGCGTAVQIRTHGEEGPNADPVHKCPVCSRVFGSGQALGGHKRSHLSSPAAPNPAAPSTSPPLPPPPPSPFAANESCASRPATKFGETSIDLNLPAPAEDDVELSAVSYSGFAPK